MKKIVKQIVQEPLEVLKQAREQVTGAATVENKPQRQLAEKPITLQEVQKRHAKARSLYTALENELKEIRAKKAQEQQPQKEKQISQPQEKPLVKLATKPSRRFVFGRGPKSQVQRQQTKTERPLPLSG